MYLTHFGPIHYPFERALQPDELFASSAAREAQARLNHLVELRGIGLITGEVGSGKTTVCRQLPFTFSTGMSQVLATKSTCGHSAIRSSPMWHRVDKHSQRASLLSRCSGRGFDRRSGAAARARSISSKIDASSAISDVDRVRVRVFVKS